MTCIVGIQHKGKIWMGGDSASVDSSYNITQVPNPKVFIRGDYIMGYTTSWRMGQILNYCGKLPMPPSKPETSDSLDKFMVTEFIPKIRKIFEKEGFVPEHETAKTGAGSFLVGTRGHLYTIHSDWQCMRSNRGWDAVGCGEQFALGSLFATNANAIEWRAESRVREALKAATYLSAGVMEPFLVRSL